MARYAFVTVWQFRAPIRAVWEEIYHSERWHAWWKGLEPVQELEPGDARGVGSLRRFAWRGALPYTMTVAMRVTRVEPLVALEGTATGDLEGRGLWQFACRDGLTTTRYEWTVRTTARWMNQTAMLARPVFRWNHDVIMRRGKQGLQRLLESPAGAGKP